MSPNATDSSAILREERKMPNGCANGWSGVSESAEKQRWKGQAVLKVNEMVEMVKRYALRAYIIFWREYILLLFESRSGWAIRTERLKCAMLTSRQKMCVCVFRHNVLNSHNECNQMYLIANDFLFIE